MPEKLLELIEILLVPIFIISVGFIFQIEFCQKNTYYGVTQNSTQQAKECHNLDTMEVNK